MKRENVTDLNLCNANAHEGASDAEKWRYTRYNVTGRGATAGFESERGDFETEICNVLEPGKRYRRYSVTAAKVDWSVTIPLVFEEVP